ncbi:Uncharacterized protein APZ42_005766, partial [Daphnia magna]
FLFFFIRPVAHIHPLTQRRGTHPFIVVRVPSRNDFIEPVCVFGY